MKTLKAFVTALLVAAILLAATSISWGAKPSKDNSTTTQGTFDLLGATWE
jgi:hypothetical protein